MKIRKNSVKWERAIKVTSSTKDIILNTPPGDYAAKFIEDSIISKFKTPLEKKKVVKKVKN